MLKIQQRITENNLRDSVIRCIVNYLFKERYRNYFHWYNAINGIL